MKENAYEGSHWEVFKNSIGDMVRTWGPLLLRLEMVFGICLEVTKVIGWLSTSSSLSRMRALTLWMKSTSTFA